MGLRLVHEGRLDVSSSHSEDSTAAQEDYCRAHCGWLGALGQAPNTSVG